ncbi:MAG: PepSY domain-containing protein [Cyclobacteriaceae bacterium]|nr:PepSY domain-containing protein [Cyclobacteriaceae bacterium]
MALQNLVHRLRQFRAWHHWVGISVALFMLITSITGVLLGWKKNIEVLQPATLKGTSKNLNDWVSFNVIASAAIHAVDSVVGHSIEIDRMDVRPDKGMIKVTFKKGYWEAQIDAANGKVLSVAQRHADWIEHVHDGSIISDGFKLLYTNYIGFGLLMLSITGFWLWYGPRRIRKAKHGS